jgi:hypothetical protein
MANYTKDMQEIALEGAIKLRTICAWCGKVIREGSIKDGISHGVCSVCAKELLKEIEVVKEYNVSVGRKVDKKL